MRMILLPTDFSKNAENACRYALDMYRNEKAHFILFHAFKVFEYHENSHLTARPGESSISDATRDVERKLKTLKEDLEKIKGREHYFQSVSHNLLICDGIRKELRQKKIELIVIGSQGHTGDKEVMYGTNSLNIIEEIENCPVLSVPFHITFEPPKEVVLAHSYKTELLPEDFDFLIYLAQKSGAALRILHIAEEGGLNESQLQNRRLLRKRLAEVKHSFHSLEHLSVPLGIYSFVESRGSGIIVIANKKHSIIENMLLNPVYKNLSHFSKVPVLVLHQSKGLN